MPITVIGSLNSDIVAYSDVLPKAGQTVKGKTLEYHLGGKGFNEAIALARLKSPKDSDISVSIWGKVGSDAVGEQFIQALQKEGVNIDMLDKINGPSGTAIITVVKSGDNRILVIPGANGELKPTPDELDHYFKKNIIKNTLGSTLIPSNMHSHITKPLDGEQLAKTVDISGHQPSYIHSHGSSSALKRALDSSSANLSSSTSSVGLIKKNGSFIHHPSINSDYVNEGVGSLKPPVDGFRIPQGLNSEIEGSIPSGLAAHASSPGLETLTYPAPKIESFNGSVPGSDLNLAAKSHLNMASNDSSARNSYLNITAKRQLNDPELINNDIDNSRDFVVIQNEFPNSTDVIHHLSKNSNVTVIYNPSPLVSFDSKLLNALHESDFIIVNEIEAMDIVKHFHPSPDRSPLTLLKNTSNFIPNEDVIEFVNKYIGILTKLRTMLTKPNIIITMGGEGILYSSTGQFSYGYVPSVDLDEDEIVDTTGCGDTFLGAFTLEVYKSNGVGIESAIKFASEAAGRAAIKRGAYEGIPKWEEVERRGWII